MTEEEKIDVEEEETSDDESETSEEDKTSEDKNEVKDEDAKKVKRSDIAQKIKFREKLKQSQTEVQRLQEELVELKGMVKKPSDDAEAKAQEYIRSQARAVFEELQKAKQRQEEKTETEFKEKVDEVLDENPDVSEEELLEAIEEYEVDPKVALKILQKTSEAKKGKPKMPQAKRTISSPQKDAPNDKGKSFWDIVKDEKNKLLNK